MIKLYNDDCLNILKTIEDKSIDLILTDPPYNISRKNNFNTMKGRTGFDFGEWDKSFNQVEWLEIAIQKIKDGGSIIVFNSFENIGLLADVYRKNGIEVKCLLRWVKTNPFPRNTERLYVNNMELALWGTKGKGWTFNLPANKPYHTGEFVYPVVSGDEKTEHPTQKSLNLFMDILNIHTRERERVLDCFMGSGTTGVACEKLNRNFIGIEIDERYYKIAQDRIKKEYNQMKLF